jgi:hypothetical protein
MPRFLALADQQEHEAVVPLGIDQPGARAMSSASFMPNCYQSRQE